MACQLNANVLFNARIEERRLTVSPAGMTLRGINIILRQDRCLFCRACEIACAVSKSASKTLLGAISETQQPLKRLRVSKDPNDDVILHNRCNQCREAACISACSFGAIQRDPASLVVHIDEKKCRACMRCVKSCGKGVLTIIRRKGNSPIAVKCDLCADLKTGPQCVRACPTNALVISLPSLQTLDMAIGE